MVELTARVLLVSDAGTGYGGETTAHIIDNGGFTMFFGVDTPDAAEELGMVATYDIDINGTIQTFSISVTVIYTEYVFTNPDGSNVVIQGYELDLAGATSQKILIPTQTAEVNSSSVGFFTHNIGDSQVGLMEQIHPNATIANRVYESTDSVAEYGSFFEALPEPVVCFTVGTQILTIDGEISFEDLKIGDLVSTLDHSWQPIRWIGKKQYSHAELVSCPGLRPIRIRAGALGHKLPKRDLIVSQQHRIYINSKIAQRMYDQSSILIAAAKLVMLEGVDIITPENGVTYVHFLCDQHEIVFSEGAPTESLFTGKEALKSVSPQARREILKIFPELAKSDSEYASKSAREIAQGPKWRKLVMRHAHNPHYLVETEFGNRH